MGREDKRLEMYFEDGGWGHEPRRARGLEKLKKTTDKTLFEPNLQNCETLTHDSQFCTQAVLAVL